MKITLIDPYHSSIHSYDYRYDSRQDQEEDTLNLTLEGFWSSVWEQGYDPDGKILDTYGDWTVYLKEADGTLKPQGLLKDLVDSEGKIKETQSPKKSKSNCAEYQPGDAHFDEEYN